jgi:hypothetical protein
MFLKEVIAFFVCTVFLLFTMAKNWGRRYKFVGTTRTILDRRSAIERNNGSKEEQCRIIFENFFDKPFVKCRPDFLRHASTNRNLELDGYNASVRTPLGRGLAFEYNGSQHYAYSPRYHKSVEDFDDQQRRDALKERLCHDAGVLLVSIPNTIPPDQLARFIRKKLSQSNVYG